MCIRDSDATALRRIDGVQTVQPERSQTVTTLVDGTKKTVTMQEIGTEGLDQPYIRQGKLPNKAGEVAVTQQFLNDSGLKIGGTITVTPQDTSSSVISVAATETDDSNNADTVGVAANASASDAKSAANTDADAEQSPQFPTKLTITGVVLDPRDLNNPDGYSGMTSFRSTSSEDYTFFAPSDGVTGNIYTAISVAVTGASDFDTFSDAYDEAVKTVADRIEHQIQTTRQKARRQQIVSSAQRKLDDAKDEANEQLDEAQKQIDDNWAELEANKTTLGIVNVTEPVPAYSQVSRVSVEQNYSLILDDITKAKEYYAKEGVENVGKQYMNTAAVAALEARVKLYMKNYEGAITAAQEAITLSGGTIVSTKEDYKNMYTTLAVSTEDIFFIAKAEDDYLSANALNTLWNKYGLSINSATIAEYSSNDIRLALLGGTWTGGKMRGITTNNQISNLPVFRLPEMYLIQAEAYAKQSTPDYGKAKEKLLEVAAKRNPDLDDSEIAEDQTIIDVIDKERKLELVQEGHRFFDARRLGKIISVADGAYTNFNIAKFVYPIPSFEVNSGFGVIQTEGWSDNLPR